MPCWAWGMAWTAIAALSALLLLLGVAVAVDRLDRTTPERW
jgi:hypothetical protein